MKALKVEWVYEDHLCTNGQLSSSAMEQVVRLAEVEKLIQEVVPLVDDMLAIAADGYMDADREAVIQRAQAFLASVAAWRERQKGTS